MAPHGSDIPDTIEACCTRHNVQIGNWKKDKLSTNSHKTAKHPQLYLIFICKTKQSSDILIEETTTILKNKFQFYLTLIM